MLARYPALSETPDSDPYQRTEWNVRDSDATVVFMRADTISPGTGFTIECATRYGKPLVVVDPWASNAVGEIRVFVAAHNIRILNISGQRESESPGIYAAVSAILTQLPVGERN